MSIETGKHICLLPKEKNDIIQNKWLTDDHMDLFRHLIIMYSDYKPVETWRLQLLDTIKPVQIDKKHIQILFNSSRPLNNSSSELLGHWVCSYYDTKNIFIYDSLNGKALHEHNKQFLQRLFPTFSFDKRSVKFPTVQYQPNGNDCGVFAIAFAISLLFNIKPEKVRYDHGLMRLHLIKILESNVIEHFPQDPLYGTFQKVFPLEIVRQREFDAARKRAIYKKKTKEQKLDQSKTFDVCQSTKELDNCGQSAIIQCIKATANKNTISTTESNRVFDICQTAKKLDNCGQKAIIQCVRATANKNNISTTESKYMSTEKRVMLPQKEKDEIVQNERLTDEHMNLFYRLLITCSDYKPVETWRIQLLDTIKPVQIDKKHIQILFSSSGSLNSLSGCLNGHWVCSYYDTKDIFIYDSLNGKILHEHHKQFLQRLFPTFSFDKSPVKFPTVQYQPNCNDCGVFAIAFAISLLFNIKPEKVKYDQGLMRSHLIKILESNVVEHFPQDPSYGAFQKVFPLAVVKQREFDIARKRGIYQKKSKEQRLNQSKIFDVCQSAKELDNCRNNAIVQSITAMANNNISTIESKEFCSNLCVKNVDCNINNIIDCDINNNNNDQHNSYANNNKRTICDTNKYLKNERIKRPRYINVPQDIISATDNKEFSSNVYVKNIIDSKSNNSNDQSSSCTNNNKRTICVTNKYCDNEKIKKSRYKVNVPEDIKEGKYQRDLNNRRMKAREYYKKNVKKNRATKRELYSLNRSSGCERNRERQKKFNKFHPDYKWLYNKRYWNKITKTNVGVKNNVAQKIIKKYKNIRQSMNTI